MRVRSTLTKAVAAAATGIFVVAALPGTAAAGTNATVCHYNPYGCGHFIADGETLRACDYRADGRRVTAWLRWGDGPAVSVNDRADGGCDNLYLRIAEGTRVKLWVCVQDVGCTEPDYGVA